MGLDNPIHIAFLLILLLLVFGAKRLPEMGRSLGSGMRGFRDALSGEESQSALTAPRLQPVPLAQAQSAPVDHVDSAQIAHDTAPIAAGTSPETSVAAHANEPPPPLVA